MYSNNCHGLADVGKKGGKSEFSHLPLIPLHNPMAADFVSNGVNKWGVGVQAVRAISLLSSPVSIIRIVRERVSLRQLTQHP